MESVSEKLMYASSLDEKAYKYDVVGFLWGEEMYDCKIHIYPHKLSSIPEYTKVYDDLINVGMVFLTKKKDNPVHVIVIRLNETNGTDIYMSENDINRVWKYLRKSVSLGMRICKEENIEIDIEKPEDILDVSMLEKDGRFPIVDEETYELKYPRRELTDDEIEGQKRKQSALDNLNNRYFFGKNLFVYHDRNCEEIKAIAPEHFIASETVPAYYFPCKKCQRMMLLRKACDPYVKQIPEVDALLRKAGISTEILEKYVMEKSLRFHIDKDGDFIVKGDEDTWLIKGFEKGKYSLWHNNYVKTAPRERYITSGFHEQKVKGKRLKDMFGYIAMYNFDVHLAGEDRKIEIAEKKEKARIREERRMKNPIYRFFKRLKTKFSEVCCGKNRCSLAKLTSDLTHKKRQIRDFT